MRGLNNKEFKIIGICAAEIHKENVCDISKVISEAVNKKGYKVFLFTPFRNMSENSLYVMGEASIFKIINPEIVDMLIILSESIKNKNFVNNIIANAKKNQIPVLVVEDAVEDCNSIVFNYVNAFEKLVRHVVEHHNCRRVNLVAGMEGNSFSQEREEVYKRVLAENGIEFEQERLGYGGFWDVPTIEVVHKFIESSLPFPEAIICCNDAMAITTCRILRENGYRVPEDVIVTGFDGIELEKYSVPRLTTASMNADDLAGETAEIIDKILKGESAPKVTEIQYTPRFSQSCGCTPMKNELITDKVTELYNRINATDDQESFMFLYHSKSISCKTDEEMSNIMKDFGDTYFWCCVNSDFFTKNSANDNLNNEKSSPFNEQMTLFSHGREVTETNGTLFPSKDFLPHLDEILDNHDYLMLCPMHFVDEVIGYLAVSFENFDFKFSYTRRFLNNTNQILESYKNRRQLVIANAELAQMHMRDPMTGIYNRRGFYKQVHKLIGSQKFKNAFVFSIDMDNLKYINDTYGHNEGDNAIKALAEALVRCSQENEIVSRFGGDEFIMFSIKDTDESYIDDFTSRINERLMQYNMNSEIPYNVVVSCGAAVLTDLTEDKLDDFINLADERMYKQKREHKLK
ncbi:MAG: GGDEF domain-containing protein [Ruminococcus sp.]|nr:GGDEF domain-containing protein [Ruminococcus sp.]